MVSRINGFFRNLFGPITRGSFFSGPGGVPGNSPFQPPSGFFRYNTPIADDQFFNADALTPAQIDRILAEERSPYAGRVLIWESAHQAGTVPQGPHTVNPAMMLGIMGAETSFGRAGYGATNPFNIRLNGSFETVKTFEDSLIIANNTMYNWAMRRPPDAGVSYFDYAGNKYSENYQQNWKPNVERFYQQFTGR